MNNNTKKTAYQILMEIASIEDVEERKSALRAALSNNNPLAIVVQRVYHPDYIWDIPIETVNEAKKSGHYEKGPFLNGLSKWYIFMQNGQYSAEVKRVQFIQLYESVATDDADLLVAVINKELPWETLNREFVVDVIPELFPSSFRNKKESEPDQEISKPASSKGKSKREICADIMRSNPGLDRKDYLKLFEVEGVTKTTGSLYYQTLKNEVFGA